ncbi:MAG TPA: DUF99 family protein [Polyangiaceae bacterium]
MAGYSNVIGFDDAPFDREHRGDVLLVGAVCARTRLDGVVASRIRRDGANATGRLIEIVQTSGFRRHLHAMLLQGIAVGGFNVIDVHAVHEALQLPVLVVIRRRPDMESIRRALFEGGPQKAGIRGARRKWRLIERAGTPEPVAGLFVQRAGLSLADAEELIGRTRLHGSLPEPIRLAHLIAGGVTTGRSRGRA